VGAGLASACLIALLAPAGASAEVSCTYVEAGPPGPPGNVLSIAASTEEVDAVAIARSGDRIAVGDDRTITPVHCAGGTPTVANVDTIHFDGETGTALAIDERQGPFAPGATDEGGAGSEIEFQIDWDDGFLAVTGTPQGNDFGFGAMPGQLGLDLNAGLGPPDVAAALGNVAGVVARGGDGRDTLTAGGGPGFAGPFASDVAFEGKGGRDRLTGGPLQDDLHGGKGKDRIDARDRARDTVHCGRGTDRVEANRRDELAGCERVRR
jgi:hypothetical protein